ncbi:MAG: DUF5758 domain-containing protein [Zoogloeaceae bacterium]|jgi:hypothetical protein|nr:DUF5758 domain-containing protein [Zoogloeaceae bacterium]
MNLPDENPDIVKNEVGVVHDNSQKIMIFRDCENVTIKANCAAWLTGCNNVILNPRSMIYQLRDCKNVAANCCWIEIVENSHCELYRQAIIREASQSTIHLYDDSIVQRVKSCCTIHAHDKSIIMRGPDNNNSITLYDHAICRECQKPEFDTEWKGVEISPFIIAKRDYLVYKKLAQNKLATLKLCKGVRYHAGNRKCRAEKLIVVKIINERNNHCRVGYSLQDHTHVYRLRHEIKAPLDESMTECASGIHFFFSKKDAEDYQ